MGWRRTQRGASSIAFQGIEKKMARGYYSGKTPAFARVALKISTGIQGLGRQDGFELS